jgi:LAO/AO transport system kinase
MGIISEKTGKSEFNRALHLFRPKNRLDTHNFYLQHNDQGASSSLGNNRKFLELTKSNDYFYKKRSEQDMADETINEQIKLHFTIILKFSNA